jgi:putative addiction module component (TIGR02574 family)
VDPGTTSEKGVETTALFRHSNSMNTVLDIGKLTRTEKLRAMEELWDDLSRSQEEYPSPEWHGEVLREREEALQAGKDEFVPWEDAKRLLREKTK